MQNNSGVFDIPVDTVQSSQQRFLEGDSGLFCPGCVCWVNSTILDKNKKQNVNAKDVKLLIKGYLLPNPNPNGMLPPDFKVSIKTSAVSKN